MSSEKLNDAETCQKVLATIRDACDQEALARAGGYIFRYVNEQRDRIAALEAENARLRERVQFLTDDIHAKHAAYRALVDERDRLRAEADQWRTAQQEQLRRNEEITEDLARAMDERDRLRADAERANVLTEEARRRVPQLQSTVVQSLGAMAHAGLDARPAVAALDELLKLASAYPAAKARAEVDAERDTNQRLTEEADRLRAERDEAVGLIGTLANHLESAVAIMTDCYVLDDEEEAADERELVAESRAFLTRIAPAKEPSE